MANQSSVATMKGSGVVTVQMTPPVNMDDLKKKYDQMMEENKALKREI